MARLRPINRWLEPLFCLVIFGALVRAFFYFRENAHFPQPFFYEPWDTWMDWFNTGYWAYEPGAYDAWGTIYPPLSFVFLRIFSLAHCYKDTTGYLARECDWLGLATLHGLFLLNVLLLWLTYRKVDLKTGIWRALALGFGLPTLYGLERGNLIVVCFTFTILGFGPLLKSARLRWISVGMAINFKVYMVAGLFAHLLRRRWRWFEGGMIATIAIYLVTYGLMGDGSIWQIYGNITNSAGMYQAITFLDLWYAATYKPLVSLITGQPWLVTQLIGSRSFDELAYWLTVIQNTVVASIGLAALGAWLRPEAVPMHRLTFLALAMAMISSEPQGYSQAILIFLVFLEPWRGFARCWCIFVCYVLCLPLDVILDRVPEMVQESYLAGHVAFFQYYVTLGPFIRPALILSLAVALSCVTLKEVLADIKKEGWQGRWRFRRDAPILPRIQRPEREGA